MQTLKRLLVWLIALLMLAGLGTGVAYATHLFPPQLPPGSAPNGFLVSNNRIEDVPIGAFARAAARDGLRVFVQHITFVPGQSTGWHTHPGPVVVTIIQGSLQVDAAHGSKCERITYTAGNGFVDRGFGHVHQATAGPAGAEFYATYMLPEDAHAVREPATGSLPVPAACAR